MRVLIVEDEDFKAADVRRVLADIIPNQRETKASSVTSAMRLLMAELFDILILDMSLPTFDLSGPGGGGSPQGQGGIEILRLTKRLAARPSIIVVSQYPDIEVDGRAIPLAQAARVLSDKFGVSVLKCVAYEYASDSWRADFREAVLTFLRLRR